MGILNRIKDIVEDVKDKAKLLTGDIAEDTEYKSTKVFEDHEQATQALATAKQRLFGINNWSNIPGIVTSTFTLFDNIGLAVNKAKPEIGDFIEIKLPAPGPVNWVKVIDVSESEFAAEVIVEPSEKPGQANPEETKHFFTSEAKSIFRVELNANELTAIEFGRNEKPNNKGDEAADREVINTAVSAVGWAAFQKFQWKNLTDYIVGISD